MSENTEPLLTAAEVAERLNLTERTIRRHAENGVLPHVRIAGSVRFKRDEIEALIADASVPTALTGVVSPESTE